MDNADIQSFIIQKVRENPFFYKKDDANYVNVRLKRDTFADIAIELNRVFDTVGMNGQSICHFKKAFRLFIG